jgi:hypothetical protein
MRLFVKFDKTYLKGGSMRAPKRSLFGFIFLFFIFVVGLAVAYFSSTARSNDYTFATGSLAIEIIEGDLTFANVSPGQSEELVFSVKNIGSSPVYLKGVFDGSWDQPELLSNLFEITQLSYQESGSWVEMIYQPYQLGEEFFFSDNNSWWNLIALEGGETRNLRLVLNFSSEAGNEYQNSLFTGEIRLAARQVDEGAEWPSLY